MGQQTTALELLQVFLTLEDGDRQLYYGGHGWSEATVDYGAFDLNGTEVLNGRFSEYDPASVNS